MFVEKIFAGCLIFFIQFLTRVPSNFWFRIAFLMLAALLPLTNLISKFSLAASFDATRSNGKFVRAVLSSFSKASFMSCLCVIELNFLAFGFLFGSES